MPTKIPLALEQAVHQRASGLCEYCHAIERWQYVEFTVDHIIPLHLAGLTILENLALACFHCNRAKGFRIAALDPDTGLTTSLFNPRLNLWADHFVWSLDSSQLKGLTAVGRATISALRINRERAIGIRISDSLLGRHPPSGDPILSQ